MLIHRGIKQSRKEVWVMLLITLDNQCSIKISNKDSLASNNKT